MILNKIPIQFGALRRVVGPPVSYQHDVVQKLVISGLDLPDYFQVDFCNPGNTNTITIVGTADGVAIPDQLLATGAPVIAYIVLTGEDEGAVETRYEIRLPVRQRPARSDIQPTPAEQLQIDELVEALNDGVARAEGAADEAEGFAGDADGFQKDAEAWAKGTRDGEPVESTDPAYQNNAKYWSEESERLGTIQAGNAEAWANGTRDGSPVPSTDPAYQNNAKYWEGLAEQCAESAGFAWFDIDDSDGHLYVYVSDDLEDGLEFEINENTGILEVTFL